MIEDHLMEWVIVPQKSQASRTVPQNRGITFRDTSQTAVGGRSMVDPVAGKTLIDKKSQKMQVKQGQALWYLALDPSKPQINDGQKRGLGGAVSERKWKR